MSRGISILSRTVAATAALTAFRAVGYDGGPAAAGGSSHGPARFDATAGEAVTVDILGESTVEAGGQIAQPGAPLMTDELGRYVPHDGTGPIVARSLGTANAAGDFLQAMLVPH